MIYSLLSNHAGCAHHAVVKRFVIFIFLLAFSGTPLWAQETKTNEKLHLSAAQAKDNIGADAVVSGKVVEVNIAEKLIRINLDKAYPAQVFTAVIFAANTNLFPDIAKIKGKNVEVSGKIAAYRDRPQIVLTSTNQLKVVATP
jgi:DNA/RNA endonuclease YhcR with UshA esterase domain